MYVFHEAFSNGFEDVEFVKFVYGVFMYGCSYRGCDDFEGVNFLVVVSQGVY